VLRRLTVRNLAIVEDLELELGEGLTVITGETGAGKSILVDALALLAGGRGSVELVRQGAATVWFYHGDKGRYAGRLLHDAERARAQGKGLWSACVTVWNPYGPATTYPHRKRTAPHGPQGRCEPAYPTVCIPPPPPDLDCAEIPYRNFRVLPPDPHNFDGDHNGIGCERP